MCSDIHRVETSSLQTNETKSMWEVCWFSPRRFFAVPVDLRCHSCCASSWPLGPQNWPSAGGGKGGGKGGGNGQVSSVDLSSDVLCTCM